MFNVVSLVTQTLFDELGQRFTHPMIGFVHGEIGLVPVGVGHNRFPYPIAEREDHPSPMKLGVVGHIFERPKLPRLHWLVVVPSRCNPVRCALKD